MKKIVSLLIIVMCLMLAACNTEHKHAFSDGKCSCGELEPNRLFVEYDEEVVYTNHGKLKVTSTYENDSIKIVSRNIGVVKIDKKQENDMILYGVMPGTAKIVITNSYDEEISLEVKVITNSDYSPILGFNVSLAESGPYHVGEVYHVNISTNPTNFVEDEYGFIKNTLYTFDKNTMEIVFHNTGVFDFQVYSSVMNITEKYEVEVVPMEGVEEYNVLFIGNSLTYVHDIPSIIKKMIEADGSRFFYIQQTVGGAYLEDHENNFNKYMDLYTFSDVILQCQSFEAIGGYDNYEKYMIKYAEKVHEKGSKVHVYQTWGYDRDLIFINFKDEVFRVERFQMYDDLQSAYEKVAGKIDGSITRSGEAFEVYLKEYPDLPSLYQDMNHQSEYGAYLSACCHYAMLTGKSPINNSYRDPNLDDTVCEILREIADRVSFK